MKAEVRFKHRTLGSSETQLLHVCDLGPVTSTSWQIDWETVETVADFIFLGFKITADGDYSHEIKRHLCRRKWQPTLVPLPGKSSGLGNGNPLQ